MKAKKLRVSQRVVRPSVAVSLIQRFDNVTQNVAPTPSTPVNQGIQIAGPPPVVRVHPRNRVRILGHTVRRNILSEFNGQRSPRTPMRQFLAGNQGAHALPRVRIPRNVNEDVKKSLSF
jgi:hypothetical protein